jgi:hypothetical protein
VPDREKLPVFRTIARAYGFAFGNLATIIGLIWLPLLLIAGAVYFLLLELLSIVARLPSNDTAAFDALQRTGFMFYDFLFGALFLYAVMVVPVTRQALGLRTGGAFVHFGLGATELRTFASLFLLYLLVTTVSLVGAYAFVLIFLFAAMGAAAIGTVAHVSPAFMAGVSGFAAWIAYFSATTYLNVRLSFFVVPVTVSENRIDLFRGWNLTRGKFWRIFWILCAIRVPLAAVACAVGFAILAIFLGAAGMLAKPDLALAKTATGSLELVRHLLPVLIGIAVFLEPLRLGLESGAAAASYRALAPAPPTDAPAANAPGPDLRSNDLAPATAAS